ncbi:hypothetical protein BZM27_52190 [Paraburkholderia steynii]|uniref:Uncharacterized protein n=1 Tax=Paraburkholderia steynii TaxID=1245441 RepID=A0A4R0WZ09_9BURK|nr:hypothetical protein BZM27_52190 [Paraburkholderia steynii]
MRIRSGALRMTCPLELHGHLSKIRRFMKLKSSRTRKGFIRSTPVDKKIANRTEWRKYILYEVDQFVGIFCVRETSGYGIWYVRNLSEDDNAVEERNGKWLLNFLDRLRGMTPLNSQSPRPVLRKIIEWPCVA